MGQPLSVDLDHLRALATEYADIGTEAGSALAQLRTTLESEGRPWGDDEPGKTFEQTYLPDANKGVEALGAMVATLHQLKAGIASAAADFHAQDVDNAIAINRDPATLGGPTSTPLSLFGSGTQTGPAINVPLPSKPPPAEYPSPPGTQSDGSAIPAAADANARPTSGGHETGGHGSPSSPPESTQPQSSEPRTDSPDPPNDRDTANGPGAPGAAAAEAPAGATAPTQATPPTERAPSQAGERAPAQADRAVAASKPASSAQTPWSKAPQLPRAPQSPPKVSAPSTGRPQPSSARPNTKGHKDASQEKRRVVSATSAATANGWIARALAHRHGINVIGFDGPGVGELVVREIAAAVNDVLPRYPIVDLRGIAIADLPNHEATHLEWELSGSGRPIVNWIVINGAVARDPDRFAHSVRAAAQSGMSVRGSEQRPVYSAVIREFGFALNVVGGLRAQPLAQRILVAHYLRGAQGYRSRSLADVVHAYREWRNQLSGSSFQCGVLIPPDALADAFTEVQLHGDDACAPAAILHQLVVDAAGTGDREESNTRDADTSS